MEESLHLEPGPNPTSKELLRELLLRKPNLLLSRIEETHAQQELVLANPVCFVTETIHIGQRKWIDIAANKYLGSGTLQSEIWKLVMRLGRLYDQDEREVDGAVHWDSMGPRLRNAFLKYGSSELSDLDWIKYISW